MISLYLVSNEENKLINKIEMEGWIHGKDQQLSDGRGIEGAG